jgi:DNA-binding response OmpR family regulator
MDESTVNILVVDDDDKLRDLVIEYLGREEFSVSGAANGEEMDAFLIKNTVDLIILDLMLPGEDGLSIARRLRKTLEIPILILSARGDEIDRIVGLEVGADDYLPKPFNPRELLARIRAILRRTETQSKPGNEDNEQPNQYHFGEFTLDLTTNTLIQGKDIIELTPGDFALLEVFVTKPNRVLSRDMLIELLKGYERSPYDRSVDVRITRLRKKIEPNHEHPQYIRTIWGKGYMFNPQGNPEPKPESKPESN